MQNTFKDGELPEDVIAAALGDNSDIPGLSPRFTGKCLAAMCTRRVRRELHLALPSAIMASLATWIAAYSFYAYSPCAEVSIAENQAPASSVGLLTSPVAKHAAKSSNVSNECVVNANPSATVHWKTLNAGQAQMAWEWPEGARSAKLEISNRAGAVEELYDIGDNFPLWVPPTPEVFDEDDVYTAKLTFYRDLHGRGEAISTLNAEGLGFVHGVSAPGGKTPEIPIVLATLQ